MGSVLPLHCGEWPSSADVCQDVPGAARAACPHVESRVREYGDPRSTETEYADVCRGVFALMSYSLSLFRTIKQQHAAVFFPFHILPFFTFVTLYQLCSMVKILRVLQAVSHESLDAPCSTRSLNGRASFL